jgi:ubiquitin-activating enzyme E1
METMGKLIKMNVVIVGIRGLGVEVAKNLILAGPKSVSLYDPDPVQLKDLGANFYCEDKHVDKNTRAEACLPKLAELNPHVKVQVIPDQKSLEAAIGGGQVHLVCQTELLLMGAYQNPTTLNTLCRAKSVAYISSATLGPWGYAFVDFGDNHMVNDHDGEQTKSFIVTMIEKGKQTTVSVHEDKRHIYQEGDFVKFVEVEGMTEINGSGPHKIVSTKPHSFVLDVDSTGFSEYSRQGVVENVKVPKKMPFHSWEVSYKNPVGSSHFGMLETPDLAKFGRSD